MLACMLALDYFRSAGLKRRIKGHQNFVSEADIKVETLIRETITKAFPEDGMIVEEDGLRAGTSGYTWVVDPIDGTTNFLDGLPAIQCDKVTSLKIFVEENWDQ